jgi:hypothetical protein
VVCAQRLAGVLQERVEECQVFGAAWHRRPIVVRLRTWTMPATTRLARA